jgi:hypothetical protein
MEVHNQVEHNKRSKVWRKELEDAYLEKMRIKQGLNQSQKKYYSDYERELMKKNPNYL